MNKEEILKIIEDIEMEEIINITIKYYKEKNYGMCDNRKPITLKIGDSNE